MIRFTDQDAGFLLTKKKQYKQWLTDVTHAENLKPGDITYIFCTDHYLAELNVKYLNHKTLTDIITFDYTEGKVLSGDIFISVERVKENADKYHVPFEEELRRVIVHGLLHLAGANDKSSEEKEEMRRLENKYLRIWSE